MMKKIYTIKLTAIELDRIKEVFDQELYDHTKNVKNGGDCYKHILGYTKAVLKKINPAYKQINN